MRATWRGHLFCVVTVLALGAIAWAQSPAPAPNPYQPTEVQALKLKVAQQDAIIAQRDMQSAQQRYQNAIVALNTAAEQVKRDNKWPEDVQLNLDSLVFSKKAPAAAPEAKDKK